MSNRIYYGNRKLLRKLFVQYKKRCCYCNRKVVMAPSGFQGKRPDNFATIEHEFTHLNIMRLFFGQWERVKLACDKCNHSMGKAEAKRVSDFYFSLGDFQVDNEMLIKLVQGDDIF